MSKITHTELDNGNVQLFHEGALAAEIVAGGNLDILDPEKAKIKGALGSYCKRKQLPYGGPSPEPEGTSALATSDAIDTDTDDVAPTLDELAEKSDSLQAQAAAAEGGDDPEPAKDKLLGCRTPAWMAWCARNQPAALKAMGLEDYYRNQPETL